MIALALSMAQVAVPVGERPIAPYAHADGNAGARPFADTRMWMAFHRGEGVARIVDGLVDRLVVDPRIADIFRNQDIVRLRRTLKEQFCYILHGGCGYSGRTMHDAHANMGLQDADLAALVEDLQAAMRREGVPYAAQNRFLARLAPMRRTVVRQVAPVAADP